MSKSDSFNLVGTGHGRLMGNRGGLAPLNGQAGIVHLCQGLASLKIPSVRLPYHARGESLFIFWVRTENWLVFANCVDCTVFYYSVFCLY